MIKVYQPGEWVLIGKTKNRAYVIKSDEWETTVVVTSFSNDKEIPIKFHKDNDQMKITPLIIKTSSIEPAPELPRIFSYDELDQALLTGDKEWYQEIMSLKEKQGDQV